jgi:EAL domain-containing protein (putative c-di-GMP-specific phosphodiesterase class I)/integral membrane sensor domain MASE1
MLPSTGEADSVSAPDAPPRQAFLLTRPRRPGAAAQVGGFLAIMGCAELGRAFWVGSTEAALIWPPAGIALGLALTFGLRILPGLAAGLLCWAVLLEGLPVSAWILPALGLIAGPALARALLARIARSGLARGPVGELLAFWAAGAVAGVGLSSLLGALGVELRGVFAEYAFIEIWAAYWTSEAFGTLVFAPLTARLTWSLGQRARVARPVLEPWHAAWLLALASLAAAQYLLARWGPPGFAAALVYFYFPLLAVCAGLGRALFTDLMVALVGTGVVALALVGGAGLVPPASNFELVDVVLLVAAVTVMTQLVSAIAEALQRHLEGARRAARRDYLTGLGNERDLALRLAEWRGRDAVLALFDVAAIRRALDLLGLAGANRIERRVAAVLEADAGEVTALARIGRGLYAAYWLSADESEVRQLLARWYDALDGMRVRDCEVPLTLRPVATALMLDGGDRNADEVLAMASQALRQAHATTGRRLALRYADRELLEGARAEQGLAERIRTAVDRADGFLLHGQPIVPLQAHVDDATYCEVLVRLRGPDGRPTPPGEFLPLAARFGLVPAVDRWVIDHGLAVAARHPAARLSINLSGASLADATLAGWIENRRRAHGAQAARICFEVTETEAIEHLETARAILGALHDSGFRIALDDFGTGLASFDYIRRFPFDYLKIDGSFVQAAGASPTERAMVEAVHSVAATAGIQTIAEFVEDEDTRAWLRDVGIDYAQGFGIAVPQPLEALLAGEAGTLPRSARAATR